MPVALPHFPESLMRESAIMFALAGSSIGSGASASGQEPATSFDGGGRWKATMTDVSLRTADQVRAWRALAAICDGIAQPIIVPMCDKRHFPAPLVNGVRLISLDDVPHDDNSPFDDDTEYVSDVVNASLTNAGTLRDTAITISMTVGGDLMGGEYFSIDHETLRWRLYELRTVLDNGDGTWDCTIRPPLRGNVDAGTALQFDRPKCVMRLATPDAMDLTLSLRKFGRPTVNFVEAFPPFPLFE